MARNPRRIDAKLRELYERVPPMKNCQGKCADSCGPIECSIRERQKIESQSGHRLEAPCASCSMLTPLGRCSVYEDRPMICRIFGTTKRLRCEHGCEPEWWLTDEEGFTLLRDSLVIGGSPPGWNESGLSAIPPHLLAQLGDVALALRVAGSLGQPLGRALESIEGTRESATPQEAEGGTTGRTRSGRLR